MQGPMACAGVGTLPTGMPDGSRGIAVPRTIVSVVKMEKVLKLST
ncbi:hypothetical protein [Flavihumibacter profundi]|nr:hypothetical protein [Flavihumibacter profundi]